MRLALKLDALPKTKSSTTHAKTILFEMPMYETDTDTESEHPAMRYMREHSLYNVKNDDDAPAKPKVPGITQRQWDVALITEFYESPGTPIASLAARFIAKNHIPFETFLDTVDRTHRTADKTYTYSGKAMDTYRFVAQCLPALYKVLEPRDPSHLQAILKWLYAADPKTIQHKRPHELSTESQANRRREAKTIIETRTHKALYGRGSKSNMSFFKT